MQDKSLIVIVGPTAVGKTKVSVELAKHLSCSVINADSRQVFKEMSVGTAKPGKDEMAGVEHYFVNDRSITEEFSAGKFEKEALKELDEEFSSNNLCIMSGGSGLYIDAVCSGLSDFPKVKPLVRQNLNIQLDEKGVKNLYNKLSKVDPEYAREIEPNNSQRIIRALEIFYSSGKTFSSLRTGSNSERGFRIHYIGLELPREELYEKINERMDSMIENGLFAEAEGLIGFREKNALQTVGYNEIFQFMDNTIDKEETVRLLKRNSRRYAKRQLTWFKKNQEIAWFNPNEIENIYSYILKIL